MINSLLRLIPSITSMFRSNTNVITVGPKLNHWEQVPTALINHSMFTSSENLFTRIIRSQMTIALALSLVLIAFGTNTVSAEVRAADIEAVFGTAVEIRPPSAIVVASNSGLVTLNFDVDSELRIGSNRANVDEVAEGDRVISTATRNAEGDLISIRTLVRVANTQPTTKHVVGIVSGVLVDQLSIQTLTGGVVDVLIPAGIDAPSIGDGITMVARLDRSSGILTAVGFELTSKTVERIQDAQDSAGDKTESDRLAQIAIDARSRHLSALDNTARAIKRVIDSGRTDPAELEQAREQFEEIQRRFEELQRIYQTTARARGEEQPQLRVTGVLVDEVGLDSFTIVPNGEQDYDPFSVNFRYHPEETMVDLPKDILASISSSIENPQMLGVVRKLIEPGNEVVVKYSNNGNVRTALSIIVRPPRLVDELEAVLEHESQRAYTGVIILVEDDASLSDALGVVIAMNDKQGTRVAAKVTQETEITLDGRSAVLLALASGQAVDIQFESSDPDSISHITGTDVTLRALAIRSRSSAPSDEDHISGIVESIEPYVSAITIRPTDGVLIRLNVGEEASIVRNGQKSTLDDVKIGDLVVDATRPGSESRELTSLVVVTRKNIKFSGTVTGIGQEPSRIQVTGDNGQSLSVLVTDDTWVIVDDRRVKFGAVTTGMNIINAVYAVAGRNGVLYNVATIISIKMPIVGRASGVITSVNVVEGKLTVLSGNSSETKIIDLKMSEIPLGDNLVKDGLPIRSLLEVERGDHVDIVFYVIKTGVIEKLSVVSDNFVHSRGTLIDVADNNRFIEVELANGKKFDMWLGDDSTIHLNGRRIPSFRPIADLLSEAREQNSKISTLVSEVLFIRDSLDSNQGVIVSIKLQIKVESRNTREDEAQDNAIVEFSVSGVIEAIDGDNWVINGRVFTVDRSTNFLGDDPNVGEVAVVVLVSRNSGPFVARRVNVISR